MKENWPRTAEFVRAWEGGLTNDTNDGGGITNFGIDLTSHPWMTVEEIIALDWPTAATIHKADSWNYLRADELPWPIDLVICDTAILCGNSLASKWLQVAVGVKPDGAIGDKTIRAAASSQATTAAHDMIEFRRNFHIVTCRLNVSQGKFLAGWLNRCEDLSRLIDS